jgi:hypothetical protein
MTPDRWIALLSSLSALGATFVALFTLGEMRRQRRSQNLISLFVPEFQWSVNIAEDLSSFETRIRDRKIDSRFPSAEIVNLGRAPATAVTVKSSYRFLDIQKFLGSYRDDRQFHISSSENQFRSLKTQAGELMVNRELDGFTSIDFISPTSPEEIGRAIFKLPLIYLIVFGEYLRLLWDILESRANTSLQEESSRLFIVTLTVEYKDIEGRSYTDHFVGEPSFHTLAEKEATGGWLFKRRS